MSGELEAAGAMATAGLVAGAIEGREARPSGEGACLNCGAALAGAYCSACGQAAHAHRTLLHMFEEVLHGLFHFDTKAWRTLPLLAFRPGTLTRNYIYGKRARYIGPLALFLFTIFLMFFVFAFVDVDIFQVNPNGPAGAEMRADLQRDIAAARVELQQAEAELAADRAARGAAEPAPQSLREDAKQGSVDLARGLVERLEARLARIDPVIVDPAQVQPGAPAARAANDGPVRWQYEVGERAKNGEIQVNTGFPALDARILHSLENPDLALYKILQTAYKFSFLLAPISLLFMWLMFIWKRGLTLYDHAVFVLYSLSFASLAFVVAALLNQVTWLEWLNAPLLFVALPAHMFFHLKGAYALSWWSTIWRTPFLLASAALSLTVFVVAIVFLGLGG